MPKFNSITEKALFTNRAKEFYGTFAEIGAGQEVVRHFFHAGSASGSIAKSMSAYDKAISDDIYGKETRYVCESRLKQMLKHEYDLLINRLDSSRGADTRFFVYANTVTTHPEQGGHAWMGIDFQKTPRSEISRVVVHVRLHDDNRLSQQEAVGIIGVNLVYGSFYLSDDPKALIESLKDHLGTRRCEIDMVRFDGSGNEDLDHRELSLHLVRKQLAKATMFGPNGEILQPAEVLYKKDVLVQRGAFRPVTKVNADMCRSALVEFVRDRKLDENNVITIMELSLNSLLDGEEVEDDQHVKDFLHRATLLQAMGHHVLVSSYPEYYLLSRFLNTLSTSNLAMVIGTPRLLDIFDEQYYNNVDGGILEAIGKLFRNKMHIYAYPWLGDDERLLTAYNLGVARSLEGLYRYLLDNNYISALDNYAPELPRLRLSSKEVLDRIQEKDASWKDLVPDSVSELIMAKGLFGASD
jgi:hypothetical protein